MLRSRFCYLVIALLLTSYVWGEPAAEEVVVAAEAESPFVAFTGRVKGQRVRLRVAPTLEGTVVRESNAGEYFLVLGESSDFYAVQLPRDVKGYVFRTFILENVVEGERVNVRLAPDMEAPVIARLHLGDRVHGVSHPDHPKWLEVTPPASGRCYIAKEYIENVGEPALYAHHEARQKEAGHLLHALVLASQSQLKKPFQEIDLEGMTRQIERFVAEFADFPEMVERAKEMTSLIQETYLQKKIAFLESKADRSMASSENEEVHGQLQRLAVMGQSLGAAGDAKPPLPPKSLPEAKPELTRALSERAGVWNALEESFFHLWAANRENPSKEEFYLEEEASATILTGVIEPYTRPVKNRPGDFLLRVENLPVAFLYSTKVDLHEKVGERVTLVAAPRPNNHFAFPAYHVLAID